MKGTVKFSAVIEIEAYVNTATKEESVEFMVARLEGMTISSIKDTEQYNWDCTLSNIKLVEQENIA